MRFLAFAICLTPAFLSAGSESGLAFKQGCIGYCEESNWDEDEPGLPEAITSDSERFNFYPDGTFSHDMCCHGEAFYRGTWKKEENKLKFQSVYSVIPTDCLLDCHEDFFHTNKKKFRRCTADCRRSFREQFGRGKVLFDVSGYFRIEPDNKTYLTVTLKERRKKGFSAMNLNYPSQFTNQYFGKWYPEISDPKE